MTKKTNIFTKLKPQGKEVIFFLRLDKMNISRFNDTQAEIFEYLDNRQNSHFEIELSFKDDFLLPRQLIGAFYLMAPRTAIYFRTGFGGEKVDNGFIVVKSD